MAFIFKSARQVGSGPLDEIITLTHYAILHIKEVLRCVSLIGNPVEIGSGPAAVTPNFY